MWHILGNIVEMFVHAAVYMIITVVGLKIVRGAVNGAQRPLTGQSPASLPPQPRYARMCRWLSAPSPGKAATRFARVPRPPPSTSLGSYVPSLSAEFDKRLSQNDVGSSLICAPLFIGIALLLGATIR